MNKKQKIFKLASVGSLAFIFAAGASSFFLYYVSQQVSTGINYSLVENKETKHNADTKKITKSNKIEEKPTFIEGFHYTVLDDPLHYDLKAIDKFFWYGCPHCWKGQRMINGLKDDFGESIKINKHHSTLNKKWLTDTNIFYTLKYMRDFDHVSEAYFNDIHLSKINGGQTIKDEKSFIRFLKNNGINHEEFFKLSKSKAVSDSIISAMNADKKLEIMGVPAFVVSGKYLLDNQKIGNWDDIRDAISYLVTVNP